MVREVPDYPAPAPQAAALQSVGLAQQDEAQSEGANKSANKSANQDAIVDWLGEFEAPQPDPTQRKPPARAALPATARKAKKKA